MTKAPHLTRPSDATLAAQAAKADKRAASYSKSLLPALIKEREREFDARMARLALPASQVRMCNATQPGTYRTGDGEVLQATRPGSAQAYTLPSRGIGT